MAGPAFRAVPVRVRTPATSANLGPGFDSFGLALSLFDDVVVRIADGGLRVDIAGECADTLSRGEDHLVVRALRAGFEALGGQPPGLEVVCANRVPHGRGLGSSASAICAGLMAARALTLGGADRIDADTLLALAAGMEGHPDNVAACLRGGFTIAWLEETQTPVIWSGSGEHAPSGDREYRPRAVRLDVDRRIVPLAFIPAAPVSTEIARGLLPGAVPHGDAAMGAGRAGLLVTALSGRPELLLAATEDRLHQDYRAAAMPTSAALLTALRAQGVPAVVSGAGPTVLALATAADVELARKIARETLRLPGDAPPPRGLGARGDIDTTAGWTVQRLGVAAVGASVLPL